MEGSRLMHAECVSAMRKLSDRSVDHTITDPPYSEKTHAKGKRYNKRGDIVDHVIAYHAPRESGPMRWNGGGKCARWHARSDALPPTRFGSRRDLIVDGQKPLAFFRQLVADFTDPGELICDPYAGGGTMAVACQELGRDCITFECDKETYNKAQHRIKEAGKQQPLPLARAKATQLQLT